MKTVSIRDLRQNLTRYLRTLNGEGIEIQRHGKPCGALITFRNEDDVLDFRLAHDPHFVEMVHRSYKSGRIPLESIEKNIARNERNHGKKRKRAA